MPEPMNRGEFAEANMLQLHQWLLACELRPPDPDRSTDPHTSKKMQIAKTKPETRTPFQERVRRGKHAAAAPVAAGVRVGPCDPGVTSCSLVSHALMARM